MNETALKWLWNKTKPQHVRMYILAVGDICISLLGVWFALLTKELIDSATVNDGQFVRYAVLLTAVVCLQYLIRATINYLDEAVITRVSLQLRSYVLKNLIRKDYASVRKLHSGEWINRMFSDVKIIAAGFTRIIPSAIGMAVRLAAACIALLFLEPLFAGIYLIIGVAMIFFISILRRRVKVLHKDAQTKEDKMHSLFQEVTEKILITKVFDAESYLTGKTDDAQEAYRAARMKRQAYVVSANSAFSMTFRLGYVLALIYGGRNLLYGLTTYGTLMAVLQLVNQIQAPVAQLSGVLTRVYEVTASTERIVEAETYADDTVCTEDSMTFSRCVFDDVSFRYNRENVLDHVSFEINNRDVIALTGISGSGKSTIFLLMMGIYPVQEGNVNIYDENGERYSKHPRSLFAYVPQGNCLFAGTIAENIALSDTYSEDKVTEALSIAAADFIKELPEGVHTVLGENGAGLSEGQMQRIAIARAVYYDAPVLLLDEATSALDEKTETEVLQNLKNLKDKTILIVTHRKAALSICTRQLDLKDGRITE